MSNLEIINSNKELDSKVEKCVPLDGKTIFKTDNLERLVKRLYSESKTAIDKNTNIFWTEHREGVFQKIANLLEDSEEKQTICAQNLQKRLSTKSSKKGRPKKKHNPWQHILDKIEDEAEEEYDETWEEDNEADKEDNEADKEAEEE